MMEKIDPIISLKEKLKNNGLNDETINYAIEYTKLNQKLFEDSIDINIITERLEKNLKNNISTFNKSQDIGTSIGIAISSIASWDAYGKQLTISPVFNVTENLSKKMKLAKDSNIFHELDHCATTEYIEFSKEQQEEYIKNYMITNGVKNKQDIDIASRLLRDGYKISKGKQPIVGVKNAEVNGLEAFNLNQLNEGITVYKQEKYDNEIGKNFKTAYKAEKKVAELISNTIGEDKMLKYHFNNDYESIKETFNKETGKDLTYIVQILNKYKASNLVYTGSLADRMFIREMNSYLNQKNIDNNEQAITVKYDGKNPLKRLFETITNKIETKRQEKKQNEKDIKEGNIDKEETNTVDKHKEFEKYVSNNGEHKTTYEDTKKIQEKIELKKQYKIKDIENDAIK